MRKLLTILLTLSAFGLFFAVNAQDGTPPEDTETTECVCDDATADCTGDCDDCVCDDDQLDCLDDETDDTGHHCEGHDGPTPEECPGHGSAGCGGSHESLGSGTHHDETPEDTGHCGGCN